MNVDVTIKAFQDLTTTELYDFLHLRTEVFVVEQNCVYQDTDNKDQFSFHLMVYNDGVLAAYARLIPAGLSYPEASIGRVATSAKVRGLGFGKILLDAAIKGSYEKFGPGGIRISAQYYLLKFYQSFGFVPVGQTYMEDGIPHIEMLKSIEQ